MILGLFATGEWFLRGVREEFLRGVLAMIGLHFKRYKIAQCTENRAAAILFFYRFLAASTNFLKIIQCVMSAYTCKATLINNHKESRSNNLQ